MCGDEPRLKIKLFDHLEVWRDGTLIPPQAWRRKTQTLLKVLLSQPGHAFTGDQLIEALFPELDPEKAHRNLRARISELRHILEPDLKKGASSQFILRVGTGSYCFSDKAPYWVDTEEFQKELEAMQALEKAGRWLEAMDSYQKAINLYRGEYLSEDLYAE
jgi:DNA-binding SARP family transcriptional activator